jgi:hypothetical protein
MRKLAAVSTSALVIALALAVVVAPASAQEYPPTTATCGVSDSSLGAGDTVTITGDHWQAGSTVTFTLQPEGTNLGSATVDANGSFSATVTIPAGIRPGSHSIECSGIDVQGHTFSPNSTIQVLGAAVGAEGTAFTGSALNVPLWLALIVGLLALGVAFVLVGRRRRRGVRTGS